MCTIPSTSERTEESTGKKSSPSDEPRVTLGTHSGSLSKEEILQQVSDSKKKDSINNKATEIDSKIKRFMKGDINNTRSLIYHQTKYDEYTSMRNKENLPWLHSNDY